MASRLVVRRFLGLAIVAAVVGIIGQFDLSARTAEPM